MKHIAIDLGSRHSQICVRGDGGKIEKQKRVRTADLKRALGKEKKARVVMETCSEAFAITDQMVALGHEVKVVPSLLVRALGVGARGKKTDEADAQRLSEASVRMPALLPSVHVPSLQARELRSMLRSRRTLVNARTMLINRVRGYMRVQLCTMRTGAAPSFAGRARTALLLQPTGLPLHIEAMLKNIECLTEQLHALQEQVRLLAEQHPAAQQCMSIPGVGPMVALGFIATVDEHSRFASSEPLSSYLGLVPARYQSGAVDRSGHISKAGPAWMRWLLVQAAWCMMRARGNHELVAWAKRIEQRRGQRIAIVALGRKIGATMLGLLRNPGAVYDPQYRSKQPRLPTQG